MVCRSLILLSNKKCGRWDLNEFPLDSGKTLILCGVFNVALNACPNKRGRKGATLKNRYLCNLLIVFLRELFGDM